MLSTVLDIFPATSSHLISRTNFRLRWYHDYPLYVLRNRGLTTFTYLITPRSDLINIRCRARIWTQKDSRGYPLCLITSISHPSSEKYLKSWHSTHMGGAPSVQVTSSALDPRTKHQQVLPSGSWESSGDGREVASTSMRQGTLRCTSTRPGGTSTREKVPILFTLCNFFLKNFGG